MRAGLEALIRGHPDMELTGDAACADVVVRDDVAEFSDPALPVVVLSDETVTQDAVRSGIRVLLPRNAPAAQIIAGIYAASAGLIAFPVDEAGGFPGPITTPEPLAEPLTRRELEVLEMLAEGLGNKMIAHNLSISEHTVKFHVNSVLTKLNSTTRTEAVMRGIRLGLVKI